MIILKNFFLWLFGAFISSGFLTILKYYDSSLKNDNWFIGIMSISWGLYCFFKTINELDKSKLK